MRRKKNKNGKFIYYFLIIVAIVIFIILLNNNSRKSSLNEANQNANINEVKEENEIVAEEEKEEKEEKKKIDFLANVKDKRYLKSEKDIKIPVLIYHAFGEVPKSDKNYGLFSNKERFDENVKTLLDAGYTFINLEEVYEYNKGNLALPEKVCVITMDDGWSGCYTEAFEVLKKYNVPATIFIINYYVGGDVYITWDQAKEMFDSGLVKIHIHGLWHNDCTTLSKEQLQEQYNTAHEEIEAKMGEKIQRIMAYPAGAHNENTIKWLKEIGYEVQVLTKYGTVNKSRTLDMTDIGRVRGELATGTQILNTINASST